MSYRVAVLLASYNGEKYIKEQLFSIVNQENVDVHIFVRDDCSDDRTRDVVADVVLMTDKVTLLPLGKSTGSAAGNFLLMLSEHNFSEFTHIALADQDDVWMTHKLIRAIKQMESKGADGYSSDLISYSIDRRKVNYINKSHTQKSFDYLFQGGSAGCTYVFSTSLCAIIQEKLKKVPIIDFNTRSHDWLIYAIARSSGCRWICDDQAHIFYRQHNANVYGARTSFAGIILKINQIKSGWYRQNILWLRQFLENSDDEVKIYEHLEKWSLSDRFYIARSAYNFRRRTRDFIILSIFVFLGLM